MPDTCYSLLLLSAGDAQIAGAGTACTQGINHAHAVTPAPASAFVHDWFEGAGPAVLTMPPRSRSRRAGGR